MVFNMSKLRGRIIEKFESLYKFAAAAGISNTALHRKLCGTMGISRDDVIKWSDLLQIKKEDIGVYFFTPDVKKTEQKELS